MANDSKVVNTLIEVLHDSRDGFAQIGEKITDSQARTFFLEESRTRGRFADELTAQLGTSSAPKHDDHTAAGTVHRYWGDLKAKLGGGDHTMLDTAEQGEDAAKKAYKETLEHADLPSSLRSTIERQQAHVMQSHDKVKAMRDAKAA